MFPVMSIRHAQLTLLQESFFFFIFSTAVHLRSLQLREFKALPLPTDSPDALPAISSKLGTSFKPFALNTENRGAVKAEKWIQKVTKKYVHIII